MRATSRLHRRTTKEVTNNKFTKYPEADPATTRGMEFLAAQQWREGAETGSDMQQRSEANQGHYGSWTAPWPPKFTPKKESL